MSIINSASRISPFVKRAAHRLYDKWETMTPEERDRYLTMLRNGASHARERLAGAPPYSPRSRRAGSE
jgi:acyl-CoA reductase-like NAD-dependent aldehyde dehydrogenase